MPVVTIDATHPEPPPKIEPSTQKTETSSQDHGPLFWTGVGAGAAFLGVGCFYAVTIVQERRARHLQQGAEFLAFQRPSSRPRDRKYRARDRSPDRSAGGVRVGEPSSNSLGISTCCYLKQRNTKTRTERGSRDCRPPRIRARHRVRGQRFGLNAPGLSPFQCRAP